MSYTNIIITAESFDENVGGIVCLHRLAGHLHELGYRCYLTRPVRAYPISRKNFVIPIMKMILDFFRCSMPYKKKIRHIELISSRGVRNIIDKSIVIYPEVTFGNPLNAPRVIRWFMHHPGFHTKQIYYEQGEYHIRYNTATKLEKFYNCYMSEKSLAIHDIPFDTYTKYSECSERTGVCYVIRKGRFNKNDLDPDWICVDGLSHEEVALVMSKSEFFVSFDPYTAYSKFATLAGCKSVVLSDMHLEEWYPDDQDRIGISLGWADADKALSERSELIRILKSDEEKQIGMVSEMINEAELYFSMRKEIEYKK